MTNVLIIDDDREIADMMLEALTSQGCRAETAHNGRVGLNMLHGQCFDLVITDIIMPEFDGFEVIMAINKLSPRPRVIAITGGSAFMKRECLADVAHALEVERVLYKPFTIQELMEAVCPSRDAADAWVSAPMRLSKPV